MNNKNQFLRTLTILMLCSLFGSLMANAEKKPWAIVKDSTMTFCYGEKSTLADNEYELNEGNNTPSWYDKRKEVTKVVFDESFKDARPTSCYEWFNRFSYLSAIDGIENLNTSEVTTMHCMFANCELLTSLDLSHFDTQKVTDMGFMFALCESPASFDLSSFNTSNVTNMRFMFFGNQNLQHIFVSDKFTTDNVTEYDEMFDGCCLLSGAIGYDNHDNTGKEYANTATGYFTDVKLKDEAKYYWVKFDNDTLTYYYGKKTVLGEKEDYMKSILEASPANPSYADDVIVAVIDESFSEARPVYCTQWFTYKNLTEIKGLENLNTSQVTNMSRMFDGCNNLRKLDLSHFDTSNVTTMASMFDCCHALQQVDLSSFNTSKVTMMSSMFDNCMCLTNLDLSHFDTRNVTDMNRMFYWCTSLKYIFGGDGFKTDKVTESVNMFGGCISLRGAIEYQEDNIDVDYANLANGYFTDAKFKDQAKYAWTKIDSNTMTFYYGKKAKLEDGEMYLTAKYKVATPEVFNVTKAVFDESFKEATPLSCIGWFFYCQNLTDIEGWENVNIEQSTDLDYMFYECQSLKSVDLSKLNTNNITSMAYLFTNCKNLKSVYLGEKFNASKVTETRDMLTGCSATFYSPANSYDSISTSKIFDGQNFMAYTDINPAAEYGTLCVPQGSDLTTDSFTGFDKLYGVSEIVDGSDGYVQLKEVKTLEPGVAYVYHRNLPADYFKAAITYKPNSASADKPITNGVLCGTFAETTAPAGSYILQDDRLFHSVATDASVIVGANQAYLQPEVGAMLPATLMLNVDGESGINEISDTMDAAQHKVYDLMGVPVKNLIKGRVYIKDGRKILCD